MKFLSVLTFTTATLGSIHHHSVLAGMVGEATSYSVPEATTASPEISYEYQETDEIVPTPMATTYETFEESVSLDEEEPPCSTDTAELSYEGYPTPSPSSLEEMEVEELTENEGSYATNEVKACTEVSIEGDATYCIEDEDVCSGDGEIANGVACPVAGDTATSDCDPSLMSYIQFTSGCVAPQTSRCVKLDTGSWGCAYPGTAPYTAASALMSTPSTTGFSAIGAAALVVASVGLAVVAAMMVWKQRSRKKEAQSAAACLANEMNATTPMEPYSEVCLTPV